MRKLGRTGIGIIKEHMNRVGWYEKYRVSDNKELEKANEIWKNIIGK